MANHNEAAHDNAVGSRFLFNISADIEPRVQMLGNTPAGQRIIAPVIGGTVEGPRLRGKILPGGADWALIRSDGTMLVDVRLTLRTEDKAMIYMSYLGIVRDADKVFARLARGEETDPETLYFRTTPLFETAAPQYAWLNQLVAVGIGRLPLGKTEYEVHEIL